jgi:hypothetical protein
MRITALHHAQMVEELNTLWAEVSSATEWMLRCSPNKVFQVEVVDELVAEFQKQEEQCSRLERPGVRVHDLILGPPSGRAWLAD